jgi:trigger factor
MAKVSSVALAFCLAVAAMSPHASAFAPPTSRGVAFVSVQTSNGIHSVEPSAVILGMSSEATASSGGIKSILTKLPDSQIELTIPVPGEVTKLAYEKAAFEVAKELSIPGFRKGARVPANIVESTLRKAGNVNGLRGEAVKALMKQLVESAIKEEHGLDPIGAATPLTPIEELAKNFQPGEPLDLKVKCDVWPDISWKENKDAEQPYFGLNGSYKRKPFNQQKYDAAIKDLCDRYATLAPMEEGGALAMGDACVVNMVGFMAAEDGVSKADPLPNAASGEDVEVILGPGRYMEGLVEGLVGAKVGDTRIVTVSFPEVRHFELSLSIFNRAVLAMIDL